MSSLRALWTTRPGIVFDGGTLQWYDTNTEDISARIATIAGGKSAILDINNRNITFNTALIGSGGGLRKMGEGTLTLAAANTYTRQHRGSPPARCRSAAGLPLSFTAAFFFGIVSRIYG